MKIIRTKRPATALNMTPLIDVVFQLLVFFMLTSAFLAPSIHVSLPKAVTTDDKPRNKVILGISKEGTFYVEQKQVPEDQLVSVLSAHLANADFKAVDIKGDENMPYRSFVTAMDASRRAGAKAVNLLHDGGR